MMLCKPSVISPSPTCPFHLASSNSRNPRTAAFCSAGWIRSMAIDRAAVSPPRKRPISASEARISLVFALTSQASSLSQR
ncbi:hypothetical protein CRG98_041084, partial [Punica granatum]